MPAEAARKPLPGPSVRITTLPVSINASRFEMMRGQPPETASMNCNPGRSIEWVNVNLTAPSRARVHRRTVQNPRLSALAGWRYQWRWCPQPQPHPPPTTTVGAATYPGPYP